MHVNTQPSNEQIQHWMHIDRQHIWHPYSAIGVDLPIFPVVGAEGVRLHLADGRRLIDGMASWWSVIHGYNHPTLNEAITQQLSQMSHVMFGGLTHPAAINLTESLLAIAPKHLQAVFYADSGSVSVDVALKMAIQYWYAQGKPNKQKFLTIRSGYHGDTLGSMSVCDPDTGMHSLFNHVLAKQHFVPSPRCRFGEPCADDDPALLAMADALERLNGQLAAVIVEPIVQGAGGMWFYSAEYLQKLRALCDQYQVLLIFDEIATGFGRTGELFACHHAQVDADIMCVGKALTGGYMTLAATLTTQHIGEVISHNKPHVFMHGPTFMANPLACAVANASVQLLLASPWQQRVANIERGLRQGLAACTNLPCVADVRVLGAIGVVELHQAVDMKVIQPLFVEAGVWVRPFGKLVYLMPPYIINDEELADLSKAIFTVLESYCV